MTNFSRFVVVLTVLLLNAFENDCASSSNHRTLFGAVGTGDNKDNKANQQEQILFNLRQQVWPFFKTILVEKFSDDYFSLFSSLETSPQSGYYAECLRDIQTILMSSFMSDGNTNIWALKYVDSWAKFPAGVMQGNFAWFGDFDECLAIEHVQVTPEDGDTENSLTIAPQYCRIGVAPREENKTQAWLEPTLLQYTKVMTIGVCVSTRCDADALGRIVSEVLPENLGFEIDWPSTYCQLNDPPMTKYTYLTIGVLSLVGLFMFVGLIFDMHGRLQKWLIDWRRKTAPLSVTVFSLKNPAEDGAMIPDVHHVVETGKAPARQAYLSLRQKATRFFVNFSPYTNFIKMMTIPSHSKNIPNLSSLHSIRALSIFWIILGHCYAYMLTTFENAVVLLELPKRFSFQFVMSGFFAVDSFLFLSGFFAYYSISRHFDIVKRRNPNSWFLKSLPWLYFHRFLRITPPYLAVILVDIGLWRHLSNGPFYFQELDVVCIKRWWSNLLFVSNFYGFTDQCAGWGWYLAVDMQLFVVLAPFLVFLFVKRPRLGWWATLIVIIGQAAVSGSMTYIYDLPSLLFQRSGPNQALPVLDGRPSPARSYFELIYSQSYSRLSPYVIGIAFGHIVFRHSLYVTRHFFTRPAFVVPLWLLFTSSLFVLIFGQYGVNSGRYGNPLIVDVFYNAFARTAWGLALGWLVLTLVVNRAGPIGRLLNWPVWALPARLSFMAYLVHPLILIFCAQTARRPFYSTDLTMIFFFSGILVSTFILSAIFSLAFESPIIVMQQKMARS